MQASTLPWIDYRTKCSPYLIATYHCWFWILSASAIYHNSSNCQQVNGLSAKSGLVYETKLTNLTSAVVISVSLEPVVAEALVRPRTVRDARGIGVAQRFDGTPLSADVDGNADIPTETKVLLIADNILSVSFFTFTCKWKLGRYIKVLWIAMSLQG